MGRNINSPSKDSIIIITDILVPTALSCQLFGGVLSLIMIRRMILRRNGISLISGSLVISSSVGEAKFFRELGILSTIAQADDLQLEMLPGFW